MKRAAIACAAAAAIAAVACHAPRGPSAPHDRDVRLRVAMAEARRGGGLDELLALAASGAPTATRVLAVRGLGRIGGERACALIVAAIGDRDPAISNAAAGAIGIAAALDVLPASLAPAATRALIDALARVGSDRAEVAEALGRAGDVSAQAPVAALLASTPASTDVAITAAIALARFGRRKLALEPAARAALIAATASADAGVRAAATWALAREQLAKPVPPATDTTDAAAPPVADPAIATLVGRLGDHAADVRAAAIVGLARHAAVADARAAIVAALHDADWRVAVEAVRALAGEHGDDAGRDAVAAALSAHVDTLARGALPEAHVVIEALHALVSSGKRPMVDAALDDAFLPRIHLAPLAQGWLTCLVAAARARAAPSPAWLALSQCSAQLPEHLRLPLVAEQVIAGGGAYADRRRAIAKLIEHADARVHAAGLGALAALWPDATADDRAQSVTWVIAALGSSDAAIASAAVDAAEAIDVLLAAAPAAAAQRATLDAAILARATRETDPELGASLLELIGKQQLNDGAGVCRRHLAAHVVLAHAAVACLHAFEPASTASLDAPLAATLPPVDVAAVIGHDVRWHLVTTRGAIDLALRPDVAPWAVATIVALTRRGFYDGLEFHRVVPGFVVQGGDPTMSGAGGPGFTIPAEPATHADGAGFTTGALGIADAGPDSGGSQWFVMHAGAPHLDGRYTWLGAITAGQDIADALLIGDAVVHATVDVR